MKSGMMPRGESALAQAVSAARRQGVDADALARVQARALASVASAPPPALATVSGPWSRARWSCLGGGVLLLVGALQLLGPELASAPSPVVSAPAPIQVPSPPAALPPPEPVRTLPIEPPAIAPPPLLPSAALPMRRHGVHPTPSVAAVSTPAPELPGTPDAAGELALLRRALAALPSRPTLALELAQQHAREHSHGVFAQEREAIAIDAELALQRTAAAEARVRRFLAAYPRSPHAPRMRALLGQQEPSPVPTHEQAPTTRRKENR